MEESIPLIYDIGIVAFVFIAIYRSVVHICGSDGISGDTVAFAISSDIYEWEVWHLLLCGTVLWEPLFNAANREIFTIAKWRSVVFVGKSILYLCSSTCVYIVSSGFATTSLYGTNLLEWRLGSDFGKL